MACREEELANVGDYVEYEIGDVSILIVRSGRRTLKGFFNSCLHRGTRLRSGCGRAQELRCRFHGWCWALDGTNLEVVDLGDHPGLDPAQLALRECRVETWAGFVFVNLDSDADSLTSFLQPLLEQIEPYRISDMRIMTWRTVRLPANWKTAIDAFNETYHLYATHLDSLAASDDVNTRYNLFPPHGRMVTSSGVPSPRLDSQDPDRLIPEMIDTLLSIQKVTPDQLAYLRLLRSREIALPEGATMQQVFAQMNRARLRKRGYDSPGLSNEQYGENWNYYLFPNVTFNLFPGEFYGFRARPSIDNSNECVFDEISLRFPEPGHRRQERQTVAWSDDAAEREMTWGHILNQDFSNLPEIQRGLRAGGSAHIHLSKIQESRIATMHRELDRYIFEDRPVGFESLVAEGDDASSLERGAGPAPRIDSRRF